MQRLFSAFADNVLLVDLAISLAGLSFMCALTYGMRWLPGKPGDEGGVREDRNSSLVLDPAEMELLSGPDLVAAAMPDKEKKTVVPAD